MKRCLNQLAGAVERSGPEIAQYLLGLPSHYCSHKFTYVYMGQFLRWIAHTEHETANALAAAAAMEDSDGESEPEEEPTAEDLAFVEDDGDDEDEKAECVP